MNCYIIIIKKTTTLLLNSPFFNESLTQLANDDKG